MTTVTKEHAEMGVISYICEECGSPGGQAVFLREDGKYMCVCCEPIDRCHICMDEGDFECAKCKEPGCKKCSRYCEKGCEEWVCSDCFGEDKEKCSGC